MKKILFGICALALSATAFGAVSSEIITNDDGTQTARVSLPVDVRANVVEGSSRLFIEGEAGSTFGDTLVLNFGDLTKGQSGTTDGRIRVYRGDITDGKTQAFGGELKVTFLADTINNPDGVDATVVGGTETVNLIEPTGKSIETTVTILGADFDQTNKEDATLFTGRIGATTEVIKAVDEHPVGSYRGAASIIAELEVTNP